MGPAGPEAPSNAVSTGPAETKHPGKLVPGSRKTRSHNVPIEIPGQVPTSPPQAGATAATVEGEGDSKPHSGRTLEEVQEELKEARKEAAANRVARREAEKKLQAREAEEESHRQAKAIEQGQHKELLAEQSRQFSEFKTKARKRDLAKTVELYALREGIPADWLDEVNVQLSDDEWPEGEDLPEAIVLSKVQAKAKKFKDAVAKAAASNGTNGHQSKPQKPQTVIGERPQTVTEPQTLDPSKAGERLAKVLRNSSGGLSPR